ncbi:MAG: FecR domain-containing protein [Lachnospiraceae bacterium]|nr:FecR domain-containing protein [Lachnospiraceae bacterium]
MEEKSFWKSKKGKAVIIAVILIIICIIIALLLRKDGYRSIAVEQVSGTVNVVGEKNNGKVYKGQRLYSGDDVSVLESSDLTLCVDNDKYIYADHDTHFKLEASSPKESSKIKIVVDRGSELSEITAKLAVDDSYEVDTPNSTMSVRGTTFRVTVYHCEDGFVYTLLEVSEGRVLTRLKTRTGEYNGVEKEFGPGESALIRGNDDLSEFVVGKDGSEVLHLDYDKLPEDAVERLIALIAELLGQEDDEDKNSVKKETDTAVTEKNTEEIVQAEPTPAEHEHDLGNWEIVKKATCSSTGLRQRKCKDCGEVVDEETIAKTDHTPGEWTTINPTCVDNGLRTQKCTVCGEVLNSETIKAKGHVPGELEVYADATCENAGISIRYCTVCHMTLETGIIPALGHDFTGGNCTEPMICSRCGQNRGGGDGHDMVYITRKSIGPKTYNVYICSRCGYTDYIDDWGNRP